MPEAILGISAYYHDSAAAILVDGEIIAAAQEERFTRRKHDPSFPANSARYVLEEAGIAYEDLTAVAFYDKPYIKFERLLETYHSFVPKGLMSFLSAIPVWVKEKLFMKKMLNTELAKLGDGKVRILFPEHHLSHAASAFYPSPYEEAAILTLDGVGEWATTAIGYGNGKHITLLRELDFPHSLGLLYAAFTYYCGFKVNSGEYKLMGLAPYGNPVAVQTQEFRQLILENLVDIKEDGSLLLNMKYFDFATGLKMVKNKKWEQLLGFPAREPGSAITREHMNLALAIQMITEEVVLRLAKTTRALTGTNNIVLAGGVALNCVANGKLLKSGIFKNVWIQPAAGDAGGALGAACAAWHIWMGRERKVTVGKDAMKGACLGPRFSDRDIKLMAAKHNARYHYFENDEVLYESITDILAGGHVVGWFQGRMEYGPRALGNRSIIADARNPGMQQKINRNIKYREDFRPFAPSVMEEEIQEYFELDRPSPYMLLVVPIAAKRKKPEPDGYHELAMYDRLRHLRSDIPSVTHIDYSARVQSVTREVNPRYWHLINKFRQKTGSGLLVNTSFNVRGEPIVCTPDDGYRCFMRTEMDYLVLGNYLFVKKEQEKTKDKTNWQKEFESD